MNQICSCLTMKMFSVTTGVLCSPNECAQSSRPDLSQIDALKIAQARERFRLRAYMGWSSLQHSLQTNSTELATACYFHTQ